jgi:hypothetical protein
VTGLLFLAWLGYLIYLAVTLPQNTVPGVVVLSRPQFLVAELIVSAHIDSAEGPVVVREVIYPSGDLSALVHQAIVVNNLERQDFVGPGDYLLALRPDTLRQAVQTLGLLAGSEGPLLAGATPGTYVIVPTPESPGHLSTGPAHIYPDVPATRAQLRDIRK